MKSARKRRFLSQPRDDRPSRKFVLSRPAEQTVSEADQMLEPLEAACVAMCNTPDGLEPDWPTRLNGLRLLLAYREGLPLRRKEVIKAPIPTAEEVKGRLENRPNYRRALRNYIDWLDAKDAKAARTQSEEESAETQGDEYSPLARNVSGNVYPQSMTI